MSSLWQSVAVELTLLIMTSGIVIYLDYHATTPCDPRVIAEMEPTFSTVFGNPASRQHSFGAAASELVETARQRVARLLGCDSREIVFTSGATESNNLAVKGVAASYSTRGRHIVTCVTEHRAVLDPCGQLEKQGFRLTYLPVGSDGRVRVDDVETAIGSDTILVSIMYANNEIGTVHPVAEIGALCRRKGVLFHCDAVQALPHLECDVETLSIDLCSVSAHKMYGPKGVGALYVRRRRPRVRLQALVAGGGHERGLRSGTLNVPGIVGLGKACELVWEDRASEARRLAALRDRMLQSIRVTFPEVVIHGCMQHRLPNNLNISFPGVKSERLLSALQGVAVSSGSACSSASQDGSYVLKSLGKDTRMQESSVRISLGRFTTAEEIDRAAEEIAGKARLLKDAGPPKSSGEECAPCA